MKKPLRPLWVSQASKIWVDMVGLELLDLCSFAAAEGFAKACLTTALIAFMRQFSREQHLLWQCASHGVFSEPKMTGRSYDKCSWPPV
eukprot:268846-Pelagomonas_calceolata.AAC.1